jgi:hypothetical protein
MASQELAYRQGLRRRASDRQDSLAYYGMLVLMLVIYIGIGLVSWLAY